jgi:hypothetical protein
MLQYLSCEEHPCLRAFRLHSLKVIIETFRANANDGFKDSKIHFGQQVRIRLNPLLIDKPIYLYSEPSSINRYSKVSRLQEVTFMLKNNFNTIWILEHPDPNQRL